MDKVEVVELGEGDGGTRRLSVSDTSSDGVYGGKDTMASESMNLIFLRGLEVAVDEDKEDGDDMEKSSSSAMDRTVRRMINQEYT